MRNRHLLIIFLFILLSASAASAQKQTGAIEGTVHDPEGQPIPGATIRISSSSLIGKVSSILTDPSGFYRFPELPAGTYEVAGQMNGFETAIQKGVRIFVTKTLTVSFTLEFSKMEETVEIIDSPPLIDVSTTAVSSTVPREIIGSSPKFPRLEQLMALTPGVGDDMVAYGAEAENSNSIWIDGVNLSDPRDARLITSYDQNWIDELQVIGIGAPAEYGSFIGVIGNFTIRSGGNQLHGAVETFYQNEKLTDQNVPNPPPERPFDSYEVSAQVGGPLIRDKLWFFTGFQYPHRKAQPPGYPGTPTDESKNIITKLSYKWNQNNTLQGFAHWNDHHLTEVGANAFTLPEATNEFSDPQASWNVSWTSFLHPQTTLEARFGGHHKDRNTVEDRPDLPGHYDIGTNISSVNAFGREREKRSRYQGNVILSHYARDFLAGNHDFRFGVEFERSKATSGYDYNGGLFYYDYSGQPYLRYSGGYLVEGSNHRTSSYAQDDWHISEALTLSMGVRWDHNRGFSDRGLVLKNDPVAPRIGMVWLLDQGTQTVIKAHYGDYYDALLERLYWGLTDDVKPSVGEVYENGIWEEFGRFQFHLLGDETLKQPYVRQFTLGVDRVLPGDIPFGVHYIYRRFGNIIESVGLSEYEPVPFVNPVDGQTITVYSLVGNEVKLLLTNPEGLNRRYDGLQLTASKQIAEKFYVSGSLVFSKLKGNSPPFVVGNPPFIVFPTNTPFLNDPNSSINFPGRLSLDRTTTWKIVGMYQLPLGFNAGWYLRHTSGGTWAATVPVRIVNQPGVRVLGEPAGSRSLPSQTLMDLRFEKQFVISGSQLRFTMDVFNLFNSAYALSVVDGFESPNFGKPIAFTEPRRIRLGARYAF